MCCNIDSVKSWRFLLTGQLMAMTAGTKRLRKYVLFSKILTYNFTQVLSESKLEYW